MPRASSIFDVLREWSELSDPEIANLFTNENAKTLRAIAAELLDGYESQIRFTQESFAQSVRRLRTLYMEGSRDLSRAIVRATDLLNQGDIGGARLVYEEFIRTSRAPFYRAIALAHLHDLK